MDSGSASKPDGARADGANATGYSGRRVFDHISALTLAQVFYRFVSLVVSIALARYLGLVEQGAYMLVMNYVAVFGSFADLGIANLVIRDMNQDEDDPSGLVSSYLSLLVIVNAGLMAASIAWAVIIGYEARLIAGIGFAGLGSLFVGTTASYYAVLAGNQRMKRVALIQVLNSIAIGACMAIVMFAGGTLLPLTMVAAVTGAISLMLHRHSAVRLLPGIRLSLHPGKAFALLKRGLPFTLHVGLYVILTRIDVLFVKRLSDEVTLGVYTAVTRLTTPLTVVSMVTAVAIFPLVSRFVSEDTALAHRIVLRSMTRLGLIGLAIAAAVTFGAGIIVGILYGPQFAVSAPVLAIAIWYLPSFYFSQVVGDLLVASDKVWSMVWITLSCLALSVAMNLVLIPRYGAYGAAWTTVVCEALRGGAIIFFAMHALGFPRKPARDAHHRTEGRLV